MDKGSLDVLDFPRVRGMLVGFCRTPMGRELASVIEPYARADRAESEFDLVDELLALGEDPGIGTVADIRPLLDRAQRGSILGGPELLLVGRSLAAIVRCRGFLHQRREQAAKVWLEASVLAIDDGLARDVARALDENGEVVDSATPRLGTLRRELRRLRGVLIGRLDQMAAEHPDWFGDRSTLRRDRYVLPVRAEYRDRVSGVVHESSASGHTLFVEPMGTIVEQNRMAELRGEETEEVARVLLGLSEAVANQEAELRRSLAGIARLDLLFAKRRFAEKLACRRPEISDPDRFSMIQGRHPLLVHRGIDVVPLDFRMPEDRRVVLISGPNAGGKTVAIKTLGLLCLMAGCGMHVPAGDGTSLPFCSTVFADIGDEQSLESDLSSFTAHLLHIRDILERADRNSLVLLDEIGSSTAPEEGAAFAVAVLETLRDRGVRTVVTSHFGVLKVFVQGEPGMANAAMGFRDGGPTYRLTIGYPGESSAFEIAARVGLPKELIERARRRVGSDWLDLSSRLKDLDTELRQAREVHRDAERRERDAEVHRDVSRRRQAEAEQEIARRQEQLKARELVFLEDSRRRIENLVREIRESQAERSTILEAKRHLEREFERLAAEAAPSDATVETGKLDVGDIVESRSLQQRGELVRVDGENSTVAFGQIRMQLKTADLVRIDATPPRRATGEPTEDTFHFNTMLDIRGMTREEALGVVTGYLDEAVCYGTERVTILHGKGTGVLQKMLWHLLRSDARIAGFRFGEPAEGGGGVTTVDLKA